MNGFPRIYVVDVETWPLVSQPSDGLLKYDLAAKGYKSEQDN